MRTKKNPNSENVDEEDSRSKRPKKPTYCRNSRDSRHHRFERRASPNHKNPCRDSNSRNEKKYRDRRAKLPNNTTTTNSSNIIPGGDRNPSIQSGTGNKGRRGKRHDGNQRDRGRCTPPGRQYSRGNQRGGRGGCSRRGQFGSERKLKLSTVCDFPQQELSIPKKIESSKEKIESSIKGFLNLLSRQRYEEIKNGIMNIDIGEYPLENIVEFIFKMALVNEIFGDLYAQLCLDLSRSKTKYGEKRRGNSLFKTYLLNICQVEFQKLPKLNEEYENKNTTEFSKAKSRKKAISVIAFLGELFKRKILAERIMHAIIKQLLIKKKDSLPQDFEIEVVCNLFHRIGKFLEPEKTYTNLYFDTLKAISKLPDTKNRIKFMIQDLLDARAGKWKNTKSMGVQTPSVVNFGSTFPRSRFYGTKKSKKRSDNDGRHRMSKRKERNSSYRTEKFNSKFSGGEVLEDNSEISTVQGTLTSINSDLSIPDKTDDKTEKTEKIEEEDIPEYFLCPISFEIMKDPVQTPSGHTFERASILKHLEISATNPYTREPITKEDLIPNRSLKMAIEAHLKK